MNKTHAVNFIPVRDITEGRAVTEAVSRRLPNAAARVQARVRSCGICGGQGGTGTGFLRVFRFPLPNIPLTAGTMGQIEAFVVSVQLHP
jgi:hypothetical protein